ncbi:MAG: DoxX family protein [Gammaproteobacteria bacterium]
MRSLLQVLGRILLSQIFIISAIMKILNYAGMAGYMVAYGLPAWLLPFVITLELGGGLMILVGWKTRFAAFALALFSIAAAVIFHHDFSNQIQVILLMSDLAIAGGLLVLAGS